MVLCLEKAKATIKKLFFLCVCVMQSSVVFTMHRTMQALCEKATGPIQSVTVIVWRSASWWTCLRLIIKRRASQSSYSALSLCLNGIHTTHWEWLVKLVCLGFFIQSTVTTVPELCKALSPGPKNPGKKHKKTWHITKSGLKAAGLTSQHNLNSPLLSDMLP